MFRLKTDYYKLVSVNLFIFLGLLVLPFWTWAATLTVVDGYDEKAEKTLEQEGKTYMVQTSDNEWWPTEFDFYTAYRFSNVSIPSGAAITSVVIHVEHWEEESFSASGLQWKVGTGWPNSSTVWGTKASVPIRGGEGSETTDTWDVTSFVNTAVRVNDMELYIGNNDVANEKKTLTDYIYAEVTWTTGPPNQPPVADSQSVTTAEDTPVAITLTGSDPEH